MIDYNQEDAYEKEFGIPAFNGDGNNTLHFNIWMRERNKELVEALIDEYKVMCITCDQKLYCDEDRCYQKQPFRKLIERNTGKKIEEVL